jgi:hypothetical protein
MIPRQIVVVAFALLSACDRSETEREVTQPREAVRQLVRCALDGVGDVPDVARLEGAFRQALRNQREQFSTRAGTCEILLDSRGGKHVCVARLKTRWAEMLRVVQRPGRDAIDQDMAIRHVGEAYAESLRTCPGER